MPENDIYICATTHLIKLVIIIKLWKKSQIIFNNYNLDTRIP